MGFTPSLFVVIWLYLLKVLTHEIVLINNQLQCLTCNMVDLCITSEAKSVMKP